MISHVGRFLEVIGHAATLIPGQVWATILTAVVLGALVTLPLARQAAYRAGRRTAGHQPPAGPRDRALFIAAMVPAGLFLAAVFAGSFRGLVAFGRDDLHWHHGWEYLVPGTLDGSAVAFAFLAFRAVRKHRSPDRAQRVVWGAATTSSVINFGHEAGLTDGSLLGGGYLAMLSLLGMVMFHELLDQFVQGAEYIRRDYPVFGMRWFTWPTNTACAWVAWRNYPPAEGTQTTVAAAVGHLETVRVGKRARRRERDLEAVALGLPGWTRIAPWVRARKLAVILDAERASRAAEQADAAARLEAEQAATERAEREAEQHRLRAVHLAEQSAAEQAEWAAEQVRNLRAERHLHAVDQEEPTEQANGAPRSVAGKTPKMTDGEALRALLDEHRAPDYGWTQREVRRITGAGPERANKLLSAITEHHQSTAEQGGAERSA